MRSRLYELGAQNTTKNNERGRTCPEALTDARNISVEARAVTIFLQAVIVAGVAKQE